jgi:hypothetical protein
LNLPSMIGVSMRSRNSCRASALALFHADMRAAT